VCEQRTFKSDGREVAISAIPNIDLLTRPQHFNCFPQYHPKYMLHTNGMNADSHVVFLCSKCDSALTQQKTPKHDIDEQHTTPSGAKAPHVPRDSILKNFYGGCVPDELQDLTLPEQLLISPIIVKCHVLKLVSYGSKASAYRAIKGNSVAFMQDVEGVITQLPCIENTAKYLKVIFVGDETCPEKIQQVL